MEAVDVAHNLIQMKESCSRHAWYVKNTKAKNVENIRSVFFSFIDDMHFQKRIIFLAYFYVGGSFHDESKKWWKRILISQICSFTWYCKVKISKIAIDILLWIHSSSRDKPWAISSLSNFLWISSLDSARLSNQLTKWDSLVLPILSICVSLDLVHIL